MIKKQNFVNAFFILLICSIYLVIEVESVYLSMKSKNKKNKGLKSFSSPLASFLIQNETNYTNETTFNETNSETSTTEDFIANENINQTQSESESDAELNVENNSNFTNNYTSNETVVNNITISNNSTENDDDEINEEENKYKFLDESDIIGINQKLDLLGYNSNNNTLKNFINEEITNLEIRSDGDVITSNCNKVFTNNTNNTTNTNDSLVSNFTNLQFSGNTSESDFKYKFISYMNDCIDNYDSFFTPTFNNHQQEFSEIDSGLDHDLSEIKSVLNDQIDAYFNLKKKVFEV